MKKLETRIKEAVRHRGTSVKKLAEKSGVSEPTIYSIFERDDAKLSQLEQMAEALDVPLYYLTGGLPDGSNIANATIGAMAGGFGNSQIMPGGTLNHNTGSQVAEVVDLATCLNDRASLQRELALALEMISTQKELINALKGPASR